MSSVITPPPQDKIGESHVWRDWFIRLSKFVQSTRNDISPSSITVGASPYTFHNPNNYNVNIIISGGTISDISFSRDNVTYYTTGQTSGVFILTSGDYLKVTYSVLPTMTSVPL